MAKINALRNLIESATRGARRVSPKISEMASPTNAGGRKLRTAGKIGLALAGAAGGYGIKSLENKLQEAEKAWVERPRQNKRTAQLVRLKQNPPKGVFIDDDYKTFKVDPSLPNADLISAGLEYLTRDITPEMVKGDGRKLKRWNLGDPIPDGWREVKLSDSPSNGKPLKRWNLDEPLPSPLDVFRLKKRMVSKKYR